MTVNEAIMAADMLRPNSFDEETKTRCSVSLNKILYLLLQTNRL